ncbi:hypothetical protein DV735_g2526, partial [Chaetothyriales sp. CBS 134920]
MSEPEAPSEGVKINSLDIHQKESSGPITNANGWDGKLRMQPRRSAALANPEALEDSDYSDPDAPPVDVIAADEDLLDDWPLDEDEVELVHRRVASIAALRLERFKNLKRLCLRQNAIQEFELPQCVAEGLVELELYDNLIKHIDGFQDLKKLTTLDLSFNKIKHIKNLSHMTALQELYFVQNRISKIENLDGLASVRMLELAGNRIREIENLEPLQQSLQELWLAKNKISAITNLSSLTSLRLLDLKSNRLRQISGLDGLVNLEELYLSHNAIAKLQGLTNNAKLRILDISGNPIASLENLSHLSQLQEFWASGCQISSFHEVERELRDKQNLETVYFEQNPLETNGPAVYRNKIRLALPQLKQIDATFVKV